MMLFEDCQNKYIDKEKNYKEIATRTSTFSFIINILLEIAKASLGEERNYRDNDLTKSILNKQILFYKKSIYSYIYKKFMLLALRFFKYILFLTFNLTRRYYA